MNDESGKPATRRPLRSSDWFSNEARSDMTAVYLERFMNYGLTPEELRSGRPIIGIAQSGSDLSPCNRVHLQLASRIRDGIRDAGGIAMEFPVHPIFENCRRPTAALDRTLAYLGPVEILNAYPLDGVVLTTGCDKTTPSQLMAAATVDLPAIVLSGGPMLDGWFEGERVGSGAVIWKSRKRLAAGEISEEEFLDAACASATSVGHCNTMGTASTMNAIAEALGMSLPGCAAIPAAYKERGQFAYETGRRIVGMVETNLKPSAILTREAFLDAIAVTAAIGGSTNAQPHITAMARHAGINLVVDDWRKAQDIPLLVNMQPAGKYLSEHFYRAGGVPAVMAELAAAGRLHGERMSVTGRSIAANIAGRHSTMPDVILPYAEPLAHNAGLVPMSGNLFDFALMKVSVISEQFRARYLAREGAEGIFEGRAIVFEGGDDYHHRINDPALAIDEDCILVMRGAGPIGWPGSAEVVNMQPPDALLKRGINSLPTLGDGRQSGTSDSPSIVHASPESAAGGGLAWLRTGDRLRIDLNTGRCDALLSDDEIAARKADLPPPVPGSNTPWEALYRAHVGPLSTGAVFEFAVKFQRISDTLPRHNH
ncbi:IlvD/Edd family dehydratase [Polymorphobacter multimanifer]|uniref:IlvD/Edd family dehydratase n=1 Tax=Polymorphobacter multimanifer TaxID=1070431 RepID=UPI00166CEF03|nr:IlvD/Edd family dehydratase [Polymorphobacter multimanifer]